MESEHNKIASRSGRKCPKMTKILFPLATSLEGSQHNFAAQIYASMATSWRKNGKDRSCTFWANRTRRTSTNQKQFWQSGSTDVITDGAIRQKTKFPIFSFPGIICHIASFWSYGVKIKFQKTKVGCYGNVPPMNWKSRFRSFIYRHSETEWWKQCENPSSGSWDNGADKNR